MLFSETGCEHDDPKIMTFRALDHNVFKNIKIALENN